MNLRKYLLRNFEIQNLTFYELFQNVKPIIEQATKVNSKELNGSFYKNTWEKIINGEAQTIEGWKDQENPQQYFRLALINLF